MGLFDLFSKKNRQHADENLRWQRLAEMPWDCSCCGEHHAGILDLAVDAPVQWTGPVTHGAATRTENSLLTPDICVIDHRDHFVRGTLAIPLIGRENEHFAYGVWSSLSEKNFQLYMETFNDTDQGRLGSWFGWFSSQLKGYPDTRNLKCRVHPRNDRARPAFELEPTDHPLAIEQREGITLDRLIQIYEANGHQVPDDLKR